MSKLHFNLLNNNQKKILEILKNFSDYGVLGGGTALMLQLPYRKSFDFDIFMPKSVSKHFLYKIKRFFPKIEIIVNTEDELSFISLPQDIKVSFICYPYKSLYSSISTPYLKIFSWQDIALDKAHTIGRRGAWRDYVDLYFVLNQGLTLKNILANAKKKFGDSFSEKLFLSQLIYIDDIKDFTVDFLDKKYQPEEIIKFFEKEITKIKL